MKRILLAVGILLLIALIWGVISLFFRLKDRHPGYTVDISILDASPSSLRAGFSAISITPQVPDSWTDVDSNAQFTRRDDYDDRNGNDRFDPVWMAGFQNKRPAMGIHDPLWARAMVIEDDSTRLALVALDAIGFLADDIIDIRKRLDLDTELGIDYTIITSTHTHEGPDLLGLWGKGTFSSGVDPAYLEFVKLQTIQAIEKAVARSRPARFRVAADLEGAKGLVEDSRKPIVLDPGIRLLQAIDMEKDTTLGVLFAWANHPETLWSDNLLLSSDFPHYVREAMEKGVFFRDSTIAEGLGGITVYVNGAIGGLMTTSPEFAISDTIRGDTFTRPSFGKAKAQGEALAMLGLAALRQDSLTEFSEGAIRLRAKTLEIPLDNQLYQFAAASGVIDRGTTGWMNIRTEVACWQLGPATFLHQPGELYPEILNGGIEAPAGQDFAIPPEEIPPLREMMPGEIKFTIGLSNDMIGYIIPKSEWDEKEPYIYDYEESPYGEINSVGPETGPLIYRALKEVIFDLKREE